LDVTPAPASIRRYELFHTVRVSCLTGPARLLFYNDDERSNRAMNWWKRLWEQERKREPQAPPSGPPAPPEERAPSTALWIEELEERIIVGVVWGR
jgi:hypothetical protein